ncbi:MAG: type II/IV secretion system protein, partial [Sutterella sp.]|nr:type II/IV secretion system protein [Sutterella sp.]
EVNIRVSTLPTTYGENIVLRLLDSRSGIIYDLPKLGMNQADYATITRCIRKPYGMILSTGPTGSGKSSSLYAILKMLNREDVNIITLEDPVEYRLPGVRQVQLNVRAGMTFSSGLRSILRQDPDIIMVGEIRDKETAEIAVQAAMTGHLVLSTLHTNDALSAVYRLVDMGVPSYLVTSVLLCTFAQRLVRTICPNCRQEYVPAEGMLRDLGLKPEDGPFYHGAGCPQCGGTGYSGRMAIFEVMPMSEEINQMVLKGESMQTVYRRALENGLHTMRRDAADKIIQMRTALDNRNLAAENCMARIEAAFQGRPVAELDSGAASVCKSGVTVNVTVMSMHDDGKDSDERKNYAAKSDTSNDSSLRLVTVKADGQTYRRLFSYPTLNATSGLPVLSSSKETQEGE